MFMLKVLKLFTFVKNLVRRYEIKIRVHLIGIFI
jgi:hypothetical protein